jgi:Flp pilus assembly secretin CpaC
LAWFTRKKKPRPVSGVIAAAGETATTAAGTTTALTAHNPANTLTATLQAFERYGVTPILAEPTVEPDSEPPSEMTLLLISNL